MTAAELIEILSECPPNAEVRIAHQPSWPFELSVGQTCYLSKDEGSDGVFYIAEQDQIGYLPSAVSAELGWRG